MTTPTQFLFGFLAIFTVTLGLRFLPVVRRELRARDLVWRENKSLRIAAGIVIAIIAAFCLGVSAVIAPVIHRAGAEQMALWIAYGLLLLGEVLIASGVGRIRVPVMLCLLWAVYVIAARFNG